MVTKEWQVVDADRGVLWREYRFSKNGVATTFTFRAGDGSLVVVSPGRGMDDNDFKVLAPYGEVKALIANNTFHHLGQPEWRKRYPNAVSYAAPNAVAKLNKKTSGLDFRSLDQLELPSHVKTHVLPGFKNGEILFSVDSNKGAVWYSGDLLTNIPRPPPPPAKWLFTLTDSAPGFKLFKLAVWFFVNNKPALKEYMQGMLSKHPPSLIVPAHGPAFTGPNVAAEVKTQLDKL